MDLDRSNSLSDNRTLVVLAGTVAATLGGIYWGLRLGFENPAAPVVNSVLLSLFLTTFPFPIRTLVDRFASTDAKSHWSLSYAFLWLAGFALAGLLGRLVPVVGVNAFPLLALIGAASFIAILFFWVKEQGVLRSAAYLLSGVAFGAWTAGVVWGRVYKNPLFVESLIVDGKVHHDTLYLSSLGNMLRTYHVSSIGIDGLNYVPYHWGSAWLFSQWANLVGIDVIHFYQLTFPVTIIPFFFGGVIALAMCLRDRRQLPTSEVVPRIGGWFWAVFIAIAVGIAPLSGLEAMGVWTSNILISESYTIAVPAALLFAAVTISWADGVARDVRDLRTAPLGVGDFLFLMIVLPAGIVLLGYLKISLMALAFAAAVFLFARVRLYRRIPYLLSMAICAVVFYAAYKQVSLPAHHEGFAPLDYLKSFVPPSWWVFFPVIHLLWTWVYAVYRCRQENVGSVGDLWTKISEGRLLDVELIVGLAIVGIIPGLIIHIDGGSAFYFSDVQRWLAGACLLSWLAAARPASQRSAVGDKRPRSRLGALPTRVLLGALLIVPAVGSVLSNATHWPVVMLQQNVAVRDEVYAAAGQPIGARRMRDFVNLRDPRVLASGLRASPNFTMVRALEDFEKLPPAARRHLAAFIPQDDAHFWNSLKRPGACTFQSLVVPALSGLAMVDGMPAVGCQVTKYYGLGSFTPRARAQVAGDTATAVLCERAHAIGADTVVVMRFPGDSATMRRVPCVAAPRS